MSARDDEISAAAFGREAHVNRSTISRLTAAGKLHVSKDGGYSLLHRLNAAYLAHRRQILDQPGGGKPPLLAGPAGPVPPGTTATTMTRQDLEKRKLLRQSERLELQNLAARRRLIDRVLVENFFRTLHGIDTANWQSMPARAIGGIATAAKITDPAILMAIEKLLDEHVFNTLQLVGKKTDSFLRSLKPPSEKAQPQGETVVSGKGER